MSKYGELACLAAKGARDGTAPRQAWEEAAKAVFPDQSKRESCDKGCPRDAFLGLAQDGLVVGVPAGKYTKSRLNKRYATKGVDLLRQNPHLADWPSELWRRVMHTEGDEGKNHNNQMDVVIGLWSNGDIKLGSAS